jgi:hypothetical protein
MSLFLAPWFLRILTRRLEEFEAFCRFFSDGLADFCLCLLV